MNMKRTYTRLIRLETFEERYEYLKLSGSVGADTFGFDRLFNQQFYRSSEWKRIRNEVISRDGGCDLSFPGHEIHDKIIVHHMNPITLEDLENASDILFDPEYLVCVSHRTHNAIHYGSEELLPKPIVVRRPNDQCPWKISK